MLKTEVNRVVVNDPFARRLMESYLEKRRADISVLRASLSAADFDHIRDKGHNLFGSGSAYGLDRISVIGTELEKAAKKGESAQIRQLIDSLESYVTNIQVV